MPALKKFRDPIRFTITTEHTTFHSVELLRKKYRHITHSYVYQLGFETLIKTLTEDGKPLPEDVVAEFERELRQDIARNEYRLKELDKIKLLQSAAPKQDPSRSKHTMKIIDPDTGQIETAVVDES